MRSIVQQEIARLADAFESADRRAKTAAAIPDREVAEDARQDAQGAFWAAGEDLADLLLLLLRYCRQHRPDALQAALVEVLRPELEPLAREIARLKRGRR